jgi:hypothetical protein
MPVHARATALLLAALTTLAPRLPAQRRATHPDVTGVWRMDTTKFVKRDAELAGLTLNVAHYGDTLVIVTDVNDVGRPPFAFTARYLPEQLIAAAAADNAPHVNRLGWEGDTLVLRSVENRPPRRLDIEERWAIDESGRTLSRLQTVVDGKLRSRQTLVFTRQ